MSRPDQRVFLFGASNLWFSRHAALREVRYRFPGRLEIGLACGPGRSYGLVAGNPVARYRPLKDVDFFSDRSRVPTLAVISDIGNDIAYGQPPEQVVTWVLELGRRLSAAGVEVVVTGVPVRTLTQMPRWMFSLLRRLYFAGSPMTQGDVNERLFSLEEGLEELCAREGWLFLPTEPDWYGVDKFHLRPRAFQACWQHWLGRLSPEAEPHPFPHWSRTFHLQPDEYWRFGRRRQGRGFYPDLVTSAGLIVR